MLETKIQSPYASLKDISEVTPYDAQKDKPLFDELQQVLRKHGAIDRFGLTLLHEHFKVGANEWLVETHDHEARTINIQPYRNEELKEAKIDLQETNWKFGKDGQPVAFLYCIRTLDGHLETL